MLIVAWIQYLGGGAASARCLKMKKKNDDHAEQWLPWETNRKQHVHRKQVNKHETYRRTMCKHSALSVCLSHIWAAISRAKDLCTAALPVLSVGFTRLGPSQRLALGGVHAVWHLDCTGGNHSHSLMFSNFLPFFPYHSIYFCLCESHFVFLSNFSHLPWRSPQVAVTRGKDDEELHSRASWLSPCSLHPVLFLTSPSSLLSPHIYWVHLLPPFSLPAVLSEGAEGQLHLHKGDFAMNADASRQP